MFLLHYLFIITFLILNESYIINIYIKKEFYILKTKINIISFKEILSINIC
jgi:hypothetical protein